MLPILSRGAFVPESDWVDREFNRMLRRMWGNGGGNGTETAMATMAYPVNIWEDDEAIHVEAEMPGFRSEDIDITLEQGMLTISAERKSEHTEGEGGHKGQPLLTERRFVRYQRAFNLPTAVDDGNVDAKLESGVLHLTLPKKPEVKPRRIRVN